jgi:hypothetical protein
LHVKVDSSTNIRKMGRICGANGRICGTNGGISGTKGRIGGTNAGSVAQTPPQKQMHWWEGTKLTSSVEGLLVRAVFDDDLRRVERRPIGQAVFQVDTDVLALKLTQEAPREREVDLEIQVGGAL